MTSAASKKTLYLLYHYYHPDDVVSARLFSDIGQEYASRGVRVVAMPAMRSCHEEHAQLARREEHDGVEIRRVWRPAWRQSSNIGRVLNAIVMLIAWSWRAIWLKRSADETVIVGTDPIFGVLVAIPWRLFRPRAKIIHWAHDLYPEAAIAEGMVSERSFLVKFLKFMLRRAYRRCNVIADLGPCMRKLLEPYGSTAKSITITPWSLVEPPEPVVADQVTRHELFGDASLTLLYSGNLGRAHRFEEFLLVARRLQELKGSEIHFCFAGRGPRIKELKDQLTERDTNLSLAGFASEESLAKRLGAGDIHLVSLDPKWTGSVVPSKFFGALAAGRPILFAGASDCALAQWIAEHHVGWVLETSNIDSIAQQLLSLARNPAQLAALQLRCFEVYQREFSKEAVLGKVEV